MRRLQFSGQGSTTLDFASEGLTDLPLPRASTAPASARSWIRPSVSGRMPSQRTTVRYEDVYDYLHYKRDGTVQKLVTDGSLHPACAALFQTGKVEGKPADLHLYKHQMQAIAKAFKGRRLPLVDRVRARADHLGLLGTRVVLVDEIGRAHV